MKDWKFKLPWRGDTSSTSTEGTHFVSLAPTDQADKEQIYSDALNWATHQDDVFNIALTGPYGSGKSSIIKSFLKRHPQKALSISLAAFIPVKDGPHTKTTRQEIERSILQQMLYGADANRLLFSRFKRIRSPSRISSWVWSLAIAVGVLSLWHLFHRYTHLLATPPSLPISVLDVLDLGAIAGSGLFVWVMVKHLYVASFGLSLKNISLNNVEMEVSGADNESILNRHLDEIVYFFRATPYELVIIEDLDRFENPDIFVTLREINKIINDNAKGGRKIRFLYALRDDMFLSAERTKFFEFIIPVIPIINSSNSIDKILAQGDRLSLNSRLKKQFLREVSRYLDDLRLIQNIFNEYAIYIKNLDPTLDANKLLAILVYKNVFPRDFEDLHRGKGKLAPILAQKAPLVARAEAVISKEIAELEADILAAEQQSLIHIRELRRVYVMAALEKMPSSRGNISFDGSSFFSISELTGTDRFNQMLKGAALHYMNQNGYSQSVSIAGLEREVDPNQTFDQRAAAIEFKSSDRVASTNQRIRELKSQLAVQRQAQLQDLLKKNPSEVVSYFAEFGDQAELPRFLVLEGYLDDSYHQYTSLFHEGRLSPRDNQFLIQIRAFNTPEPTFQIDNPSEVIAAMRDDDFAQSYVLNVKIVDRLMSDPTTHKVLQEKLLDFMATNFDHIEEFLAAYYDQGVEVASLVSALSGSWTGFVPAVLASKAASAHVSRILALLPESELVKLSNAHPELSGFVATKLSEILSLGLVIEPERLGLIEIQVQDLGSLEANPAIVRYLFDEGLYQISIANLDFIFRFVLGVADLQSLHAGHLTSVLASRNQALQSKIEREFAAYLLEVLLKLDSNTHEGVEAILMVLSRDEQDPKRLVEFLAKQTVKLPALSNVPSRLHAPLFILNKVEATWANCIAFIKNDNFKAESLGRFLAIPEVVDRLISEPMPSTDQAVELRRFVFQNEDWSDDVYRRYVRTLPLPFKNFPSDAAEGRNKILIQERKVGFSKETFASLSAYPMLQVLQAALNIDSYVAKPTDFPSDDDFREKLLKQPMTDAQRLQVIDLMDPSVLPNSPVRARVVGDVLVRSNRDISEYGPAVCTALIVNAGSVEDQIRLFNRSRVTLDETHVRQILEQLPLPFKDIKLGYLRPTLPDTEGNVELVTWLEERGIISSWSRGGFGRQVIRVNNRHK
ncbi:hypothetical protein [Aquidulcibacter sp.]|uniref:YobI family P-loop NTPase n=1 Tax=Aquidulcibacter sp. TaxID=2052990 RepID=UPI0028AA30F2|nr:hypothetical protein [Aquidulcibacter sp.]